MDHDSLLVQHDSEVDPGHSTDVAPEAVDHDSLLVHWSLEVTLHHHDGDAAVVVDHDSLPCSTVRNILSLSLSSRKRITSNCSLSISP